MIIQPNLPGGYVIFCDDVREEVRGKSTLVGVYGDELTVYGTAPVAIPMLGVVVHYRDDPSSLPKDITFKIFREDADGSETIFEAETNFPALPDEFEFPETTEPDRLHFMEAQIVAKISPLRIPGNCELKVRAFHGEDEIRLGALRIKVAPRPSEAPAT